MSLEQIIKDNTAALVANTAALLAQAAPVSSNANVRLPAGEKTPPGTPNPPPAAADALTYDVVAKVVSEFVKANGRAPAVILLEPLKVTTITGFKDKPAELAQIYAIFTDPVKIAAAKSLALANAAAAAKPA